MEEKADFNLSFNDPENPYNGFTLRSKISQRGIVFENLCKAKTEVDVIGVLVELQNVDDSIISELVRESGNVEHWRQEAVKWQQQAELLQQQFAQFRSTHF